MTTSSAHLEQLLRDAMARLAEGDAFGAADAMSTAEQAVATMDGTFVDPTQLRTLRALHSRIAASAEVALRSLRDEIGRRSSARQACSAYRLGLDRGLSPK